MTSIGKNIKTLRKGKNMTQSELGDLLGKSLSTIQKYESDEIDIPWSVLNTICNLFKIENINEIVNYSEEASNSFIGNNIRKARRLKGLSQSELAFKTKLSLRSIQKYESGEINNPCIETVKKISEALGVSQSKIIGESKEQIEIKKFTDGDLIGELKSRGYTISKIF